MHDDAISAEQRSALSALKPAANRGFYLAGGTALCLRLAHRRSIDLDLFREQDFDPQAAPERPRRDRTRGFERANETEHDLVEISGVRTSLMRFPYPTLVAPEIALGVPVASSPDIAAMKIEAIASRGARKDFYDLYFICRDGLGLASAVEAFERRFESARPDLAHRLKALTFFDDAEREPEPILLRPVKWDEVRQYFEREVRTCWHDSRR
jgi:hypothetical protein